MRAGGQLTTWFLAYIAFLYPFQRTIHNLDSMMSMCATLKPSESDGLNGEVLPFVLRLKRYLQILQPLNRAAQLA